MNHRRTTVEPSGRRLRRISLHTARWLVLLSICVLIRAAQQDVRRRESRRETASIDVARLRPYLPSATAIDSGDSPRGGRYVLDARGNRVGQYLTTSPRADRIIGYSGPTNVLIVLDTEDRIRGIEIISSRDTPEHVGLVKSSRSFRNQFRGRSTRAFDGDNGVDGVSGATLTSLAIIESIKYRLSGKYRSLRFPDRIRLGEVRRFLPEASSLRRRPFAAVDFTDVLDRHGRLVGHALRGSPSTDRIVGYQGPSDVLLVFDGRRRLLGFILRKSFDNQPYVRYVVDDELFREVFQNLRWPDLARFDLEAQEVEGVSGATMTSMAVARVMIEAARLGLAEERTAAARRRIRWTGNDAGTLLVMLLGTLMAWTRWGRIRRVRQAFLVLLVIYFGFLNGDMLSQSLLVGWTQHGLPWRLAPGLMLLAAAAFLIPAWSGNPWYCHQVCPFGAAQMLLRRRTRWHWRVPRRLDRTLRTVPALILAAVLFAVMTGRSWNLASVEPFHAFLWPMAGWATVTIAVVGLALSLVRPMAYCRYGCPTGALLEYVRYKRHGDRLRWGDAAAVALLIAALFLRWTWWS